MSENDYSEMTERERMEARAIASLLGEASPFEEAALEDAVAADEELKRFVEDMRKTISWVESTETESERGGAGAGRRGPRLAWSRRWRLKRAFRGGKSERDEAVAPMPNRNAQIRGLISIAACVIVSVVTLIRWPIPSFLLEESVAPKAASDVAPIQRGDADEFFERARGAETRSLGRSLEESDEPTSGPQANRSRYNYFKRNAEPEPAVEGPTTSTELSTLGVAQREESTDGLASESKSEPTSEFFLGLEANSPTEESEPAVSQGIETGTTTFESLSRRAFRPEGEVSESITRSRAPSRRAAGDVEGLESTLDGDRAISRNAPTDGSANGSSNGRRAFGGALSSEAQDPSRGAIAGRARGRAAPDVSSRNQWGATQSADDFISQNGVADSDSDALVAGDAISNFSRAGRFGLDDKSVGSTITGPAEGVAVDTNGDARENRLQEIAEQEAAIEDLGASTAQNDFSFSADSGLPSVAPLDGTESSGQVADGPVKPEAMNQGSQAMRPEMMAMYGYSPGMMPDSAEYAMPGSPDDADKSGAGAPSSEGGMPDASRWMESGAAFGRSTSTADGADAGLGGGGSNAGGAPRQEEKFFGAFDNGSGGNVNFYMEPRPASPPFAGEPLAEEGARHLWSMPDAGAEYGVEYDEAPTVADSDLSLDVLGQELAELEEAEIQLGTELQSSTGFAEPVLDESRNGVIQDARRSLQSGQAGEAEAILNEALNAGPSNATAGGYSSPVREQLSAGEGADTVRSVELADQDAPDSLSLSLNKKLKETEPMEGTQTLGDLVVDAPQNDLLFNDRVGIGAGTSPSFTSPVPSGSPLGIADRPAIETEQKVKKAEVAGKSAALEDEVALKRRARKAPEPEITFNETLTEDEPFATFSLNVSDVSFKTTEASLNEGRIPDPEQIRTEEFVNAFDYRESWDDSDGALSMVWDLARNPLEHRRDILRILMRTESEGRSAQQPINLVVLLDNSGSMDREDRREIVDASLKTLAANLRPTDQVSFMTFAREPRLWVDRAPGGNPDQLLNQTLGHQPGGATNLELALDSAYQVAESGFLSEGKNRVLLLTDGAANLGDIDPERLREMVANRRRQGIALDCFGIGWTDYEDALLEALARNGDGRYGFLNDVDKAETEFGDQLLGVLRVAAEDVKVQVEFNPERVASYRQMGYRKHRLKKEDFRNNAIDAAEIAAEEVGTALFVLEQRPDGRGPIATVRARYRDPATKEYSEQEWSILATGATTRLEDAAPNMRLAASAALFAEWLEKGAPMGSEALEVVNDLSRDFPEIFGGADRPQRLLSMTRIAWDLVSSR